jgi:AcrB/AcrD/AcrF family
VLPFIILLAVPMAVLGALIFISMRGLVDDVYVQIGLVMLIGLSAKNSILIVEFAEHGLEQGRSVANAVIEAAELRLRPILMTSFAFVLGVLPLYFATAPASWDGTQSGPRSLAACCSPPSSTSSLFRCSTLLSKDCWFRSRQKRKQKPERHRKSDNSFMTRSS